MKILSLICGLVLLALTIQSCKKKDNPAPVIPKDTTFFAKGADIGWLTQMEAPPNNIKFYDSAGVQQDCMQILKGVGINSVRLRAWVPPTDGWNNTSDVVVKAVRAKAMGLKIMIDFHY